MKRAKLQTEETKTVSESEKLNRYHFEQKLQIDRNDLDSVVIEHCNLFRQVGEEHVLAVSRRDEVEDEMKKVASDIDAEIREAAEESEKKKPNETAIKNMIAAHDKMVDMKQRYADAKREADLWGVLKESYHARRYMIALCVELHNSGYYTPTSMGQSRDSQEREIQDRRKRMQQVREESRGSKGD